MENRRNTEQKRVIMHALSHACHPTASELYETLRKTNPKISRATVFRVLSSFADSGDIRRLEFLGSDTRYDARLTPHAHCHCVSCGAITDVFGEEYAPLFSMKNVEGFQVYSAELEFSGLCPACAQERAKA